MAITKKRLIFTGAFAALAGVLLLLSMSRQWVEDYYTNGIYPYTSAFQRIITGILPFSLGDIIYGAFLLWVTYFGIRNIVLLFVHKITLRRVGRRALRLITALLCLYVFFMLIWGLNYSRLGIRDQLGLERPEYREADLLRLQDIGMRAVNETRAQLSEAQRTYPKNREMFQRAAAAYRQSEDSLHFLKYRHPSLKSSLFGSWGNYLGFTGYYNPFTGEAQINTTVPRFLVPAITLHEMAHQIGYAKENEANFVAFLVASHCDDPLFRYSAWLDLLMYTNAAVRQIDTVKASQALEALNPEVRQDIAEWRRFSASYRSFMEPIVHWVYEKYLKLNKQSKGMKSYDEVVSLVIAYYKKEGLL